MNKNRQQDNFKILDILFEYLKKNPDIRFGQALSNLNLATHRKESELARYMDIFYEEPSETLTKIKNI